MSLTTTLTNPAIKLYQRCGYSITTTAAPPSYARRLQVGGRVLMERTISGSVATPGASHSYSRYSV